MVEKRLRKSLPNIFANILTRKLFGGFFKFLTELVVAFGATGETDDGHCRWQFSSGGKIIQRRNQFPMGQVSGCATARVLKPSRSGFVCSEPFVMSSEVGTSLNFSDQNS